MAHDKLKKIIETFKLENALKRATLPALTDLARHAAREKFEKNEYIFNVGDESSKYYVVENGRVVLSKEAPSGKAFTCYVAVKGIPLNAVACLKPRPRFFSARAVEKTTVIAIPSPIWKQWVMDNPRVSSAILDVVCDLLDGAYTRIVDLIDESVEQRVLNTLYMLSLSFGSNLPMTNNDIADLIGASREAAARAISRLQGAGLLTKSRGKIKILNLPKLDKMTTSPFFRL